ncbi:VOC family protein [Thermoleptolyngbya oregonensis NK1-22]|uniref:Bleomycin resistance protein n=1 Tax=Thermoleptolyngbya oregonensis NK1-22 TaxID=2547457 RepID=A0AA97BAE0_9CYAN|nr:VOC family protein [Thermoleptolyngbya oregonensis NK1-22]
MMEEITIPEPLWSLLRCCEVNCVAACCGLDAFDFSPAHVQKWMDQTDAQTLNQARDQLQVLVHYMVDKTCTYSSEQLNFWGDYSTWKRLFNQWETLMMPLDQAIPILLSRDIPRSVDFYQKLGFESRYPVNTTTDYVILCRGSLEIHLSFFPDIVPSESHLACYLRVAQVDELFQAFQALKLPAAGIPRLGSLEDKSWGMREFYIVDPDGNLLKIGQVIAE